MMMKERSQTKAITYPRMSALKSWMNIKRQSIMQAGTNWLQRSTTAEGPNPYLEGVFAPVSETEQKHFEVVGEIPQQLNGIFLRIGPNPIESPNPNLYHWFSGDGMIHGLRIESGKATWFKSRYIATDHVQKKRQQKTIQGDRRGPGDVVNTNAFFHANKIWAMVEAGTFPVCLDLELNTERYQLLNSDADLPFTAHPHLDPKTQHLHAICYDALNTQNIFYEVFDELGALIHWAQIPVKHGPMIHDCAITEQDVIIFDFPVTFSKEQVLKGSPMPYEWNPQHAARIGIMPKYGNAEQVIWIDLEPCFVFHAANAYREKNSSENDGVEHQDIIILDLVVHDRMFEQSKIGPFEQQKTQLERWTIDLKNQNVIRKILDEQVQEFPRIDERFTGVKHRYIYSVGYDSEVMNKANQLFVHDVISDQKSSYIYGDEWLSGEVVFVPESKTAPEGCGYLMTYVHHVDAKDSKIMILKVNGLAVDLQTEIRLNSRVPLGFHANWVDLS